MSYSGTQNPGLPELTSQRRLREAMTPVAEPGVKGMKWGAKKGGASAGAGNLKKATSVGQMSNKHQNLMLNSSIHTQGGIDTHAETTDPAKRQALDELSSAGFLKKKQTGGDYPATRYTMTSKGKAAMKGMKGKIGKGPKAGWKSSGQVYAKWKKNR